MAEEDVTETGPGLDGWERGFNQASALMLEEVGFGIEGLMAMGAPVDTGFLKNTVWTMTHQGQDTHGPAPGPHARHSQRLGKQVIHPGQHALIENNQPGPNEVWNGASAEYALYQEMGTVNHAAQPFARPAQEQAVRQAPAILLKYMKQMGVD